MRILISVCLGVVGICRPVSADWHLKQVATFASGLTGSGEVVCGDFAHDSLPEISFWHGDTSQIWSWQIWKYGLVNRYELVQSDTCIGFEGGVPPPGFHKGLFTPTDAGDADLDGKTDVLGVNEEFFADSVHCYLCIDESPNRRSTPDSLTWRWRYPPDFGWCPFAWFPGDLDGDGRREILFSDLYQTFIFENHGDNAYDSVFTSEPFRGGSEYAFGDFDQDGRNEFVFVEEIQRPYRVVTYKCTGDDQYEAVDSLPVAYVNADALCAGDDVDGNGKPEFFVEWEWWNGHSSTFVLCMYESNGLGSYTQYPIDSIGGGGLAARNVVCCDIDGDGKQEVLMSWNRGVGIYKATGPHRFQRVWIWHCPAGEAQIRHFDMNRNGYPDIIISGGGQTNIFEVEAVKATRPQPGELVRSGPCAITWQKYEPPSCDSFSLFYTNDNNRTYTQIAHGLSPEDTSYVWNVPEFTSDSCRVKVVAFGPGTQFDETDTFFSMRPAGIAEAGALPPFETKLVGVFPNPLADHADVRFDLREQGRVRLSVCDVSGRVVATLADGVMKAGSYRCRWDVEAAIPSGVYFLRLSAPGFETSRKVVVQ